MLGNCKKENICPDDFPDFNLGSFTIIKSMFIVKNVTHFRKTVETGVNPHLTTTTNNNNNNNNNNVIIKTKISYPLLFASLVLNKRLIRFYQRKETENTSLSQAKESQPPPTLAYNHVSRPRITLGMEGSSF